jgi:AcrR family transcriptional regulator
LKKCGELQKNTTEEQKMAKKEKRPDLRIQRTRHFIKEAFLDLLAEKEYDAITIQAVTEHAMVNRATFYLHYVDKQDLLNQCIEDVLQELETFQKSHQPHMQNVIYLFDHVAQHAHFYTIMLADLHLPIFIARLSAILHESFSQALVQFQPDEEQFRASKEVLISYLTGAHLSVLIWWLNHEMAYTSQHMAKQLYHLAEGSLFYAIGKDTLTIESL